MRFHRVKAPTIEELSSLVHQLSHRVTRVLEKKGWLRRQPDVADRRRKLLWLTPEGERAAGALKPLVEGAQQHILEPLSADEQKQLVALLSKLVTHHPRRAAT